MRDHASYFIDANVPMCAAGGDHPYREVCLRLLRTAATGQIRAVTDAEVIQEITHRFGAIGRRAQGLEIAGAFLDATRTVLPVTRQDVVRALALLRTHDFLASRDAVHVAVMETAGLQDIVTADRHFDRIPGIHRVDPTESAP